MPPSKGRRRLFHLVALVLSLLLFVGAFELLLRLGARQLGPRLGQVGNYTYTRYGRFPGDIYYRVEELDMLFMKPDFETVNYWNGYFWRHRTDARGFRNPPDAQDTSLLVVGDSFVYGHGVAEEDTLTAFLRSEHHRPAYNLGRQGYCLYQEYVLLRLYTEVFRPREVVLVVFVNDFYDLTVYRTPEQLRTRPEIDVYPYGDALRERVREEGRNPRLPLAAQLMRLRTARLLRGAAKEAGWISLLLPPAPIAEAAAADTPPTRDSSCRADRVPRRAAPWMRVVLDWEELLPLLDYTRVVLRDLHRRLSERDIRFTVLYIESDEHTGPLARRTRRRAGRQLAQICTEEGIRYLSLLPALRGCPECFLPSDGHFTREGHRRVAAFLDRTVLAPR